MTGDDRIKVRNSGTDWEISGGDLRDASQTCIADVVAGAAQNFV